MIQSFNEVHDYDVVVLTNGGIQQVENKLDDMNNQLDKPLPVNYRVTYLSSFNELLIYLDNYSLDNPNSVDFNGKIFFMFFNGLSFVQEIVSESISYYHRCLNKTIKMDNYLKQDIMNYNPYNKLANCYFYFDSSIFDLEDLHSNDSFNFLVTIVSDVLKKTNFMVGNIRGIVIDDLDLKGEKIFPIHCLLRNYPGIERIELSSESSLCMKDLIF